jgi:hypothetical protein
LSASRADHWDDIGSTRAVDVIFIARPTRSWQASIACEPHAHVCFANVRITHV